MCLKFARMLQIFTDYLFRWAMKNGPLSFLGHDSWAIFYMGVITQTQELPRTKLCIVFIHVLSNWKVSPPCLSYLIIVYRCIYMYLNIISYKSSHFLSHAARCKVQMSHGWTIPSRLEKPCLPSFFPRNISCLGSSCCWTETTLETNQLNICWWYLDDWDLTFKKITSPKKQLVRKATTTMIVSG